jgi:hypothetical protein
MAAVALGCAGGEVESKFTESRAVLSEGAKLRLAPAEFAGVIEELALGTPVTAVADHAEVSHDDLYVEVELADGRSGFVERAALGSTAEWQQVLDLRASIEGLQAQATGQLKTRSNLRIAPGQQARVMASVAGKTPFGMFRRVGVMEGEDKEIWYLVDLGEDRVGYVFTRKLEFAVPRNMPSHARYRRTVGWQRLGGGDDHPTWLVASAGEGDLGCDFDRAEIYAWDPGNGAYGTMFTKKELRGVLPLGSEEVDGTWTFIMRTLNEDGSVTATRWSDSRPARIVESWSEDASEYLH